MKSLLRSKSMQRTIQFIVLLLSFISIEIVIGVKAGTFRLLAGGNNKNKKDKNEPNFPTFYSALITKKVPVFRGPGSCPLNSFQVGYSNMRRMMLDIATGNTQNSFNICPGSVFNIRVDLDVNGKSGMPLVIPFDNVTINCGDNGSLADNCVIAGGSIQVALSGKNITMNGIRFTGSEGISILAVGPSTSDATFNDCLWRNNSGYSAVYSQYIDDKDLEKSIADPEILENYMIDEGETPAGTSVKGDGMKLVFNDCYFNKNSFSAVVMHTKRSALRLKSVMFKENDCDMADIILAYGSDATIQDSCFIDEGDTLLGNVYVSDDSSLQELNSYASGTTSGFSCNSILYDDFRCASFSASECAVNSAYYHPIKPEVAQSELTTYKPIRGPTVCSSDGNVTGYTNLRRMLLDMETYSVSSLLVQQTFTLCPDTVYNISSSLQNQNSGGNDYIPLLIPFDNVLLNCGLDGSVSNNCVLSGGLSHLILSGNNISINGLTFQESIGVSVMAVGPFTSSATFNDCHWKNNEGYAAIFSQYDDNNSLESAISDPEALDNLLIDQGEAISKSKLGTIDEPGMQLVFSSCKFADNMYLDAGVIHSISSRIVLMSTIFENNIIMKADVILNNKSTSYITNTCFDKGNMIYGNMFVSDDSKIFQKNNYAEPGSTTLYDCDNIFQEVVGSPCFDDDTSACTSYTCMAFTSKFCVSAKVENAPKVKQTYNLFKGPGFCDSNANETGYNNLRRLIFDVAALNSTDFSLSPTKTFNLCSNTIYKISDDLTKASDAELPLLIPFDDITINCGASGSLDNNCIFAGGMNHIVLSGKNITINGITFRGNKGLSIMAIGDSAANAVFNNCYWYKNKGYALVYAQYDSRNILEDSLSDFDALDKLMLDKGEELDIPSVDGAGMRLTFSNCLFKKNKVQAALIYCGNSTVTIDNAKFENNIPQIADIVLADSSLAALKSSCFYNESSYYGKIFVSSDSTILISQNYGDIVEKEDQLFGCNHIFQEGFNDTCLNSLSFSPENCNDYQCTNFSAPFCGSHMIGDSISPSDEKNSGASEDVPQPELVSSSSPPCTSTLSMPQPELVSSSSPPCTSTLSMTTTLVTLFVTFYYVGI